MILLIALLMRVVLTFELFIAQIECVVVIVESIILIFVLIVVQIQHQVVIVFLKQRRGSILISVFLGINKGSLRWLTIVAVFLQDALRSGCVNQ